MATLRTSRCAMLPTRKAPSIAYHPKAKHALRSAQKSRQFRSRYDAPSHFPLRERQPAGLLQRRTGRPVMGPSEEKAEGARPERGGRRPAHQGRLPPNLYERADCSHLSRGRLVRPMHSGESRQDYLGAPCWRRDRRRAAHCRANDRLFLTLVQSSREQA